jgi:hypothetical protein
MCTGRGRPGVAVHPRHLEGASSDASPTPARTTPCSSPWLEGAATATSTLLFVDAWFDVLTSSTRAELVASVTEALLVELPLAVLCVLLARGVVRRLATTT